MIFPTAAMLTIGDELLSGHTLDSNAYHIAGALRGIGVPLRKKLSVGDKKEDIMIALSSLRADVHVLLTTGGLGPTSDDITKECLAAFFEAPLQLDETTYEQVRAFVSNRDLAVSEEAIKKSASLPRGAVALPNEVGLAAGLWMLAHDFLCISLPGVPQEMMHMLEKEVLPRLAAHFHLPPILQRSVHTIGLRESVISERLATFEAALPSFITLSYLPHTCRVSLTLTLSPAVGADKKAHDRFQEAYDLLLKTLDGYVYGTGSDTLLGRIKDRLLAARLTVGTGESCTGGRIAAALTETAGSSQYFAGGVVAYQVASKVQQLGVSHRCIATYGVVSQEIAISMAQGARRVLQADVGVASTGMMEASPEHIAQAYVAVADEKGGTCHGIRLGSDRAVNTEHTMWDALQLLWRYLCERS